MEWIREADKLLPFLQIGLDIGLIALVLWLFRKRSRELIQVDEVTATIRKVFADTQALAEGFDANLKERQQLMRRFIAKLDQQIREARSIQEQMEQMKRDWERNVVKEKGQPLSSRQSEQRLIHQLAQQGMEPRMIAQRLKKPVGEIELVLNLRELESKR